jgi:sec-independent protein translocase protein TatC
VAFGVLAIWPGPAGLYDLLAAPLVASLPHGATMIATNVISPFLVPLKITMMAAFLLALPVVLYQVWAFVAPGLYSHEKKLVLPLVISSTVLFFTGVAFCYFFVFGKVFKFIQSFAPHSITAAPDIEAYLSFVLTMFVAFGAAFEVPVAVVVLARMGIVSVAKLREFRGYFIVLAFIIAAILTPPDIVSQLSLAIPMCLLYELGIVAAGVFIKHTQFPDSEPTDSDPPEASIGQAAPPGRASLHLLPGPLRDVDLEVHRLLPSQHAHHRIGLRLQGGHHVQQLRRVADGLAGDAHHHIPGLHAGLAGRAVLQHAGDQHALGHRDLEVLGELRIQIARLHADPAARHLAVPHQAVHHLLGQVDGNGEADAHAAAGAGVDGGVDADEVAVHVDQRAAGVAGVDRRVGLDEVLEGGQAQAAAAQGADDARGHRLADVEGVADGQHRVAHHDLIDPAQADHGQAVQIHLQHRDVAFRVGADQPGLGRPAIGELHLDLVGAVDHVVVGQQVALGRHDHARAQADLGLRILGPVRRAGRRSSGTRVFRMGLAARLAGLAGRDADHGGRGLARGHAQGLRGRVVGHLDRHAGGRCGGGGLGPGHARGLLQPAGLEGPQHEDHRHRDGDRLGENEPDSAHDTSRKEPMAARTEIEGCLNQWLQPERFKDYGPNGLQVEGRRDPAPGVGVTASLALIDAAIAPRPTPSWCTTACSGAGRMAA